MSKRDYYDVLGVDRSADEKALKSAYRKLAMKYHPDQNQGDPAAEEKFKEVGEAYAILSDAQQRAAYDRFGHAAFENGNGAGGGHPFGQGVNPEDIFQDLFSQVFGGGFASSGGRKRGGPQRGADLRYDLEITLAEAWAGKEETIHVPQAVACGTCEGSGCAPGYKPETCETCAGHGRVRAQQGFFTIERACPQCGGAGQIIEKPCKTCQGQGRTRKERTLSVNIPAGVEDGTRIRLAGEGEAGLRGGPAGDLYVFLGIKPHRFFQREASNLYCRVPVPITTVALGGNIEVPTIDGKRMKVAVPAGTQTGQQFRLKGKGMTVLRSPNRGDMFVEVAVETPVNLTKRQKELLQEFAGDTNDKTNPQSSGFFDKVKGLWEDLKD